MGVDFALFGLLILVSIAVWVFLIKLSDFLSPRTVAVGRGSAPIESGERTILGMRTVGFQYFFYPLIFVILEAIFLLVFLWAESARFLGAFISMSVIISLLYIVIIVRYLLKVGDKISEGE